MKKLKFSVVLALAFVLSALVPMVGVPQAELAVAQRADARDVTPEVIFATEATSSKSATSRDWKIFGAYGVLIPVAAGAGVLILMACGHKIRAQRRAVRAIEAEIEIEEQVAEIIAEPEEPVVERFTAEPVVRVQPKITQVDSFIFQKR